MFKIKLLFFTIILGLTGCTRPQIISSAENTPEPEIVVVDEPDEPETPETPEEPHIPKVFEAEDVATYFNDKGEEEGIAVTYIEEEGYWYLHYILGESTDESMENLYSGISYFLEFIPIYSKVEGGYIFRHKSKYIIDPEIYFVYVGVSSNHFAAVSIYSYIELDNLTVDVIIYDGRNGLKEER